MNIQNREEMDRLFTVLNAALNKGLETVWTGWERFCMSVPSTAAAEKYPMSLITGSMREWIGSRVVNKLDGKLLTVRNRDFEHTEGVNLNDLDDNQVGLYLPLFQAMGVNATNLWGVLGTEALCSPGTWADNTAFYRDNRKIGKATINNLVPGALSGETFDTAFAQMMAFQSASGDPLGLVPDTLIVGPANRKAARRIVKAEIIAEDGVAVSNTNAGTVEIVENPYIVGEHAAKWFLVCSTRGIKPIAVQKRKVGPLVRWDRESDPCVKDDNRAEYGLHYRGAAAAVAPHLVVAGGF